VTFVVSNSGNVRLGGVATVSIAGPFGIGETKVALPALTELLPGQHVNVVANLKGVPALVIDTTHVSVVPSGAADLGTLKVVAVTNRTFAPPITALIILCIVLFAVLAWRAYRRHRRAGLGAAAVERSADEREYQPT
jgi:hypothetical protein